MRRTIEQRVWPRIVIDGNGCWIWQGAKTTLGYGQVCINYKLIYAHRLVWELTVGPIPKGMNVLHRCDNPPCVNPLHLFLGTQMDNVLDCRKKGRNPSYVINSHCRKGHEYSVHG